MIKQLITKNNVGLTMGILVFVILWFIPIQGLSPAGSKALAISSLTAIWWIFNLMPPAFPAILACILFYVLKVAKPADAFGGFISPSIWMLLFALVIAAGVDKSGLAKRIASLLMSKMPLSFNGMVAVFIAMCFIFPFFIPAAAAYVALIMTLAVGFLEAFGIERNPKNKISAGLTCFIGILALTLGRVPLTGAVANFVATGLVRDLTGVSVTWTEWISSMWVVAPIPAIATYFYITRKYKPDVALSKELMREQVKRTVDSLGPISSKEIRALILVLAAITLWIIDPYLNIGTNQIGILIGILFIMPYIGCLNMNDFKGLSWDTFIFAGGSYSIGIVLTVTGFSQWAAAGISSLSFLQNGSFFVIGAFVILLSVLVHILIESMGEISLTTPILVKTGLLSPKAVSMLVPYGDGLFLFPYQATPIILSLGFNTTGWSDVTRYGIFLTIIGILQAMLWLSVYWVYTMA
ncbi:MAG: SLC13 family permease [Desulfotomaculaceae bacterium]|nr:SLC13 family permease [Desulfotomaculaceae bacterium]